jgi:hypothetical protein
MISSIPRLTRGIVAQCKSGADVDATALPNFD